jgi:hypothetical protein
MSSFIKQVPSGRFTYERSYETELDQTRNQTIGKFEQRFRSKSIGEMDASGNRTNRQHFHEDESHKVISSGARPDTGPHTFQDLSSSTITKAPIMNTVAASASEFPKLGK